MARPLPPRPRLSDAKWYPLAGALLVGGPVWEEFYRSHYPLAAPEATLIPVAAGVFGLVVAVLSRRLPEPLATLGFAALVTLFVDFQFDLEQHLRSLLIGGIVIAVVALFHGHRAFLTVVCLAAFYLSSLPASWPAARARSEALIAGRRPILLHVVLDAQWGPAGLRAAGDSATADFLSEFYSARGFRLYQGAYSHYNYTMFSLGSLVALGGVSPVEQVGPERYKLTTNPYFKHLTARGYHLRVFQTSYLDLCSAAGLAGRCLTADASSLGNVGYLQGQWRSRAVLVARFFLTTRSHLYVKLHGREGLAMRRSSAGRAVDVLNTVRRAISAREADAYFVHVLLPHGPFEVDSTCTGHSNLDRRLAEFGEQKYDSRRMIEAYAEQTRCAHRMLAGLLATLDSTVGRDQAIVVVQGDHGSRLLELPSRPADYSAEVLNGYFSTLFAIRAPSLPPGSVPGAVPIQELFHSLVASDFTRADVAWGVPYVVGATKPRDPGTIRILSAAELLWVPVTDPAPSKDELPVSHGLPRRPVAAAPRKPRFRPSGLGRRCDAGPALKQRSAQPNTTRMCTWGAAPTSPRHG